MHQVTVFWAKRYRRNRISPYESIKTVIFSRYRRFSEGSYKLDLNWLETKFANMSESEITLPNKINNKYGKSTLARM